MKRFALLLWWTVLWTHAALYAQSEVTVQVIVAPPFSTHFSDYIDQPDKLQVIFTNTTGRDLEVYIQGSLQGDNGITIQSDPAYRMPTPVVLPAYGSYQLTPANVEEVFSSDHLIFSGIDREALLRMQALPEGQYQFCFEVYDYHTQRRLSDEQSACSNPFQVIYKDPPQIISPTCGSEITATDPPFLLISWMPTPPVLPQIKYRVVMVEIVPPGRDPIDALMATDPQHYFISEEDLDAPQLIVDASYPALHPGSSYAFFVQAYDPEGRIPFKNNGTSEVCWFTYKAPADADTLSTLPHSLTDHLNDYLNDFAFLPRTKITGRLLYLLGTEARKTGTFGQSLAMESRGAGLNWNRREENGDHDSPIPSRSKKQQDYSGRYQQYYPRHFDADHPVFNGNNVNHLSMNDYDAMESARQIIAQRHSPPYATGIINGDLFSTNGGRGLGRVKIRLVSRLIARTWDGKWRVVRRPEIESYEFFDLTGRQVPPAKVRSMLDTPLAAGRTDENGRFVFDFQADFFTGPVRLKHRTSADDPNALFDGYVALRVEVENLKFASPDVDIFALPGDELRLPDQPVLIRDYFVNIRVLSTYDKVGYRPSDPQAGDNGDYPVLRVEKSYDIHPKVIKGGQPIPGAKVRILRDMQRIGHVHKALLMSEGNQKNQIIQNRFGKFKVVYEGLTDDRGEISVEHLIKRWKRLDGDKGSPYYYQVTTRAENKDKELEFSRLNYCSDFGKLIVKLTSKDPGRFIPFDKIEGLAYNSEFVKVNAHYPQEFEIYLRALPPEIKGHILAKTNLENISLAGVVMFLFNKDQYGDDSDLLAGGLFNALFTGSKDYPSLMRVKRYRTERFHITNRAGFFRFRHLPVRTDSTDRDNLVPIGPYRRIQIYSDYFRNEIFPPLHTPAWNLSYGELKNIVIQVEPRHILKGEVVNENGQPVPAYLKILPSMPYVKTESKVYYGPGNRFRAAEEFALPVREKGLNRIEVVPLSNRYFTDTIRLESLPENNYLTVRVRNKLHRLMLYVVDDQTGKPLDQARVIIGDSLATGLTSRTGRIALKFASPGDEFLVKISREGHAPVQRLYRIPVSATAYLTKTVRLQRERKIYGTVTDKESGLPVEDALIYVELQHSGGHSLTLSTRSDDQGRYNLGGIPYDRHRITVHVVKEGSHPSYLALRREITFPVIEVPVYGQPSHAYRHDFRLRAVDKNFSELWGFPLVVEDYRKNPEGQIVEISGYLHHLPGNLYVHAYDPDLKLYFHGLKVRETNGKPEPVRHIFETDNTVIPLKLEGGFEARLTHPAGRSNWPLQVRHRNGETTISGLAELNLSAFNFAYDFHGKMYVGSDTVRGTLDAFITSDDPGRQARRQANLLSKYYIFQINGQDGSQEPMPLRHFRIFGFPASARIHDSYYRDGLIRIGTVLHTQIPIPAGRKDLDLKIRVGQIRVTRDNIYLDKGNEAFAFDLEKWHIRSTGPWYFDKNRDALILTSAVIETGMGINAPVRNLNIRPYALREGELDMRTGLTLGGVVPLTVNPQLKPVFNYDPGVGHYRISLVGHSGQPAVWADHLPALDGRLEFKSLDLLSDRSTEMAIGKIFTFHHIFPVYVDQISSGGNFFTLSGMPMIDIPKMISSQAGITYYKRDGRLRFRMEPLKSRVDCNANTVYILGSNPGDQQLKDRLFTSDGIFRIYSESHGKYITVKGHLVKTPETTRIDVLPQDVRMGKEPMHVTGGRITANTADWNELSYKAYTLSKGLDRKNEVTFRVHGGLKVDTDHMKVDNIDTPFGGLMMTYLFDESALVGKMDINVPISMGYATLNQGQMETRFDPDGFYFGLAAELYITALPVNGGLIIGYYNKPMTEVNRKIFAQMRKDPVNQSTFAGFYFMGETPLVNKSGTLAGVIDLELKAGLGAYVGGLFTEGFRIIGGGYGYLDAKGGINVPLCGFVGVTNHTWFNTEFDFNKTHLSICGCGSSMYKVEACKLSGRMDVICNFHVGHGGNAFGIHFSGTCPQQLCVK